MAYTKLIQTGGCFELYEYEGQPAVRLPRRPKGDISGIVEIPRGVHKRRGDNLMQARKSFQRLVRGNLSRSAPALLTLTMLGVVDIGTAYKCYSAFGQRIRFRFGRFVSWVAVPEFQKRGAVHFHVLIWGLPGDIVRTERQTRLLAGIWSWGFVDIIATNGSQKLGTYLSKYMTKALGDIRLARQKGYTASRNVVRPVSLNNPREVDFVRKEFNLYSVDNPPSVDATYATLWLGRCHYQRFDLISSA